MIFDKGAVMVLPASVNKVGDRPCGRAGGSRSLAANVVTLGDAENDHALLRMAEFGVGVGVAVANAVPTRQMEADHISARLTVIESRRQYTVQA